MIKKIIAWDLGATKCTAGIVEYDEEKHDLTCSTHHSLKVTDVGSLDELIHQLETRLALPFPEADAICIGGAGYYNGETLLLENGYPYPMHFAEIAKRQNWPAHAVIHDYAPIVCATFTSYMQQPDNIKRLNSASMQSNGRRVAFGVGTSLGLKDGVMLENGDFWLGKNEAGFIGVTIPPAAETKHQQRHDAFMAFLHKHSHLRMHQPITFEQILSGRGTARLHQFFYPQHGEVTPEEAGIRMRDGKTPELVDAFAWYLGLFVGTIQLSFMPDGGIWITGGVAINHLEVFDSPDFYAGIQASPAYHAQRESYPLGVLCNPHHALMGGGYYAVKRLI